MEQPAEEYGLIGVEYAQDNYNKLSFTIEGVERNVVIHTKYMYPRIFDVDLIFDNILKFLEEDPCDAAHLCQALTKMSCTTMYFAFKHPVSGITFYNPASTHTSYQPCYVQYLKSCFEKQKLAETEGVDNDLPHYDKIDTNMSIRLNSGFLKSMHSTSTYMDSCVFRASTPFFARFSEHWCRLFASNNPDKRMCYERILTLGVDYFMYRYAAKLNVLWEYRIIDNSRSFHQYTCCDCDAPLYLEYPASENNGKEMNFLSFDKIFINKSWSDAFRVSFGTESRTFSEKLRATTIQPFQLYRTNAVSRGSYGFPREKCPIEEANLSRNFFEMGELTRDPCFCSTLKSKPVPVRCISCINRRWPIVTTYEAWGMIMEELLNDSEDPVEIPLEFAHLRMLPCEVANCGTAAKLGNPSSQKVLGRNFECWLLNCSKHFSFMPKRNGPRKVLGDQKPDMNPRSAEYNGLYASMNVHRKVRVDHTAFRLLTLLPVRDFVVPRSFVNNWNGLSDDCGVQMSYRDPPHLPFPVSSQIIDTQTDKRNSDAYDRGIRSNWNEESKLTQYLRVLRACRLAFHFKEDVEWLIESYRDFKTNMMGSTLYSKWHSWLDGIVLRKFFGGSIISTNGSRCQLDTLDEESDMLTQCGYYTYKHDLHLRPFKYKAWLGTIGSVNPNEPFLNECAQDVRVEHKLTDIANEAYYDFMDYFKPPAMIEMFDEENCQRFKHIYSIDRKRFDKDMKRYRRTFGLELNKFLVIKPLPEIMVKNKHQFPLETLEGFKLVKKEHPQFKEEEIGLARNYVLTFIKLDCEGWIKKHKDTLCAKISTGVVPRNWRHLVRTVESYSTLVLKFIDWDRTDPLKIRWSQVKGKVVMINRSKAFKKKAEKMKKEKEARKLKKRKHDTMKDTDVNSDEDEDESFDGEKEDDIEKEIEIELVKNLSLLIK